MRQCVRCGIHLDEDRTLRCKKCKERVDEEFRGEISRPFEYYFRHHLKKMRQDREKMEKIKEGI